MMGNRLDLLDQDDFLVDSSLYLAIMVGLATQYGGRSSGLLFALLFPHLHFFFLSLWERLPIGRLVATEHTAPLAALAASFG